jgi:hypothetical protein
MRPGKTDVYVGGARTLYSLAVGGHGMARGSGVLLEELELAAGEATGEPALGGVVEDGEGVEKGDAELGEGVEILGEGVDELCGDGAEGEGEDEVGRETAHGEH